ncbi:MAG TPA: DUF2877 domain-containing protein [Kiritimatiellia bacterium]|nr:DUF2877 domain-containing protein [Kiritimatiellia bacterium]HRZ13429.1 DUF2877 domain-containing protein [Kiritimatiellia bacterium]HSA18931.1 DUF2877 domain-containing protein [Kiritimatiellia bacterium]
MKVVSAGDRVEAGAYRLHSRFRRAANFTSPTRLVVLSDRSVGSGPISIVVDGELPKDDSLTVEPDALLLGGRRYSLGPRYDSALPGIPPEPAMVEVLVNRVRAAAHPKSLAFLLDASRIRNFGDGFEQNMIRQIQAGASKLFGEDPTPGVRLLRGCGFGLTPAGDDLLAGALIGWRLREGRVPPRPWTAWKPSLPGGNVLSESFLALAAEGRVNEPMKNLLTALGGAEAETVRAAANRVLAHGETSGADILTGLVLAVHKGSNFQQPTPNRRGP